MLQTPNFFVGLDDRVLLIAGHSDTFAFALPGGEPLASWAGWPLPRGTLSVEATPGGVLADLPPILPPSPARADFQVDPSLAGRRVFLPYGGRPIDVGPARPPVVVEADGDAVIVHAPGGPRRLRLEARFLEPRPSADGSVLAARTHDESILLDVASGELRWRGPPGELPCLSADGRWAAVLPWGASRIGIVDVRTGALHTPEGPSGRTRHLGLDGDRVVVGHRSSATLLRRSDAAPVGVLAGACGELSRTRSGWVGVSGVRELAAWGPDGGEPVGRVALDAKPLGFAADREGRVLVGRHETGGLCLWDLPDLWWADPAAGRILQRVERPSELCRTLAASPEGDAWLVSDPAGTELFDGSWRPVARWDGTDQVAHEFSSDGRRLARLREGSLEILDRQGRVLHAQPAAHSLVVWPGAGPITASEHEVVRWSPGLEVLEARELPVRASGVDADDAGFAWIGDDGVVGVEDWRLRP